MLKRIIGLIGAITALGAPQAVQAGPVAQPSNEVLKVSSYAELLDPIPNAAVVLKAVNETSTTAAEARIEKVQWHHHHHHWWRHRWYHHHHHHHWYHHHHHHHHHYW